MAAETFKAGWSAETSWPFQMVWATLKVRLLPPRSTRPAIWAMEPGLLDVTVTLPFKVSVPPSAAPPLSTEPPEVVLTEGFVLPPPLLLKTKPAKVFAPARFKTPGPLRVTIFEAAI